MTRNRSWHIVFRFSLALLGLFFCYRLIIGSVRYGVSRLLSTVAMLQVNVEPADTAVRINPADPEAHYARALSLANSQRLAESIAELKQAIGMRPHHYYQWLDLGVTIQRVGGQQEAEVAIRESIRLAPSFAQPHWQLGNLLYLQGRYQEAFDELRRGAKSNPALAEGMLDLAWVAANEDVGQLEALVQPESSRSHLELARFLAKRSKGIDAARQVRKAGRPLDEAESKLLHQTISELLALGSISDAFDVWVLSHPNSAAERGQILNGDFVEPILADDPGFGWQLPTTPNVLVSIDPSGPSSNTRSLRLEFSGESSTASPVIHQLVLMTSNGQYSISFLARTEKLISGGPPVVVVSEAAGKTPKILGQSQALSPDSADWKAYIVDFSVETTSSIVINLQRLPCKESPCPVFGKLWLSGFRLSKK
jgi:tetratricopeptide (TPR) repeat protein